MTDKWPTRTMTSTATSRYPSDMVTRQAAAENIATRKSVRPRKSVVIGTRADPRVAAYQAARARANLSPAMLLDYRDLTTDPEAAAASLPATADVRIDSPGRSHQVLAGLLGHGVEKSERMGLHHLKHDEIGHHVSERGRLLPPRQIYFGLEHVLAKLEERSGQDGLAEKLVTRDVKFVPDIDTIALTFDKTACRQRLAECNVAVPPAMPPPCSFDQLIAAMEEARMPRVFVKLQHGSAAVGTVALATSKFGVSAVTTVEMVRTLEGVRLYNTRRPRKYTSPRDIERLVNCLAPYGLHVEAWIPKASIDGCIVDLRVLVINGEPMFYVLRKSVHPITNLHLGGGRAEAGALLVRMSDQAVVALGETCRAVARAMPGALQLGIDVAVVAGFARHYVLEVNAFGDLLKGIVTPQGRDPYDLQLQAMERMA